MESASYQSGYISAPLSLIETSCRFFSPSKSSNPVITFAGIIRRMHGRTPHQHNDPPCGWQGRQTMDVSKILNGGLPEGKKPKWRVVGPNRTPVFTPQARAR
jgi:hypothetical protein